MKKSLHVQVLGGGKKLVTSRSMMGRKLQASIESSTSSASTPAHIAPSPGVGSGGDTKSSSSGAGATLSVGAGHSHEVVGKWLGDEGIGVGGKTSSTRRGSGSIAGVMSFLSGGRRRAGSLMENVDDDNGSEGSSSKERVV